MNQELSEKSKNLIDVLWNTVTSFFEKDELTGIEFLDVLVSFVMRCLIATESETFKTILVKSINLYWEEKAWEKS